MLGKIILLFLLVTNIVISKEIKMDIYDFNVKDIDGEEISMSKMSQDDK